MILPNGSAAMRSHVIAVHSVLVWQDNRLTTDKPVAGRICQELLLDVLDWFLFVLLVEELQPKTGPAFDSVRNLHRIASPSTCRPMQDPSSESSRSRFHNSIRIAAAGGFLRYSTTHCIVFGRCSNLNAWHRCITRHLDGVESRSSGRVTYSS